MCAPRLRGDEQGVALPLALVGLVAVTLLVGTALVTASTEFAISSAHQDATRSLYLAEGGLHAFIAARGTMLDSLAGAGAIDFTPIGGAPVRISVVHLGEWQGPDSLSARLYSVRSVAEPGGRAVAALATLVRHHPLPLQLNLTAAVTLGGHLDAVGSGFRVSGRALDPECGGGQALRVPADSEIVPGAAGFAAGFQGVDGEGNQVEGEAAIDRGGAGRADIALDALGGTALEALIPGVPPSHRWGGRFAPPDGPDKRFDGRVDPGERVAVVDGEGGVVRVEGGSGLLIVLNGSVEMHGDARFDGVIIAAGSFRLDGRARVSGAVIGLSEDIGGGNELHGRAFIGGDAGIQYDRCAVDAAAREFAEITRQSEVPAVLPTYGWQEVLR